MLNIWTIAKREYKLYFESPVAYVVMGSILLVLGIFFYLTLKDASVNQYVPGVDTTLGPMPFLMILATPAVTTRLLAEEQRLGTIELLLTAPVRDWELVIGKWLGAFLFFLTIVAVTLVYPLLLNQFVDPGIDQGPLISGYLGMMLLTGALLAIGVAVSSLFSNQIAAFFTTIAILILLCWVVGPIAQVAGGTGVASEVLNFLDLDNHYFNALLVGIIDLRDVVYYLSMIALGLLTATVSLETRRWR